MVALMRATTARMITEGQVRRRRAIQTGETAEKKMLNRLSANTFLG
jgi:hypothetical protein